LVKILELCGYSSSNRSVTIGIDGSNPRPPNLVAAPECFMVSLPIRQSSVAFALAVSMFSGHLIERNNHHFDSPDYRARLPSAIVND